MTDVTAVSAVSDDDLLREALEHIKHTTSCAVDMAENWPCHCIRARITARLARGAWIPVSERLPDDREDYLVLMDMDGHLYRTISNLTPAMNGFYVTFNEDGTTPAETAMAWQPLPPLPKEPKK